MNIRIRSLLFALAMTGVATPVHAGVADWTWSWPATSCGGTSYATCMSGTIEYYEATKTIWVSVTNIANASDGGDIFTAVGLFNLPATGIATGCTVGTLVNWACGTSHLNGGGMGNNQLKYSAGTNGIMSGFPTALNPGATQSFTFTFSQSLLAYQNSIGVAVHAQGGVGGCSTKMGVQNTGVVQNQDPDSYDECRSVPEPGSLALLATGAAGLAFVARRRRDGAEIVDEEGDELEI